MATTYTKQQIKEIVASALNLYCFQNIWNEEPSEFRVNIIPHPITLNSGAGNVYLNDNPIPLPTQKESYYIYEIPATITYGINNKLLESRWISSVELCNEYDILLHAYHLSGKMFHKGFVYIYPLSDRTGYLLAINKKMANRFVKHKDMLTDVRVTIYYDSDITNKITVKSYKTPVQDSSFNAKQEIIDYIKSCNDTNDHLLVFIDGYETYLKNSSIFTTNTYIDIIHDENAVFAFDVDLTNSKYNIGFYSEMDKTYKQIVHIPKKLNPDNNVYTHNTMDIYVRKKNKDGSKGKGVYLHRCAERSVTQVTHNDIAIPMFILDAFRDYLEEQDVTLHVVVRKHDKDNVLVRDKSYIDLLYTLDDQTIMDHLVGKISNKLDFWKASQLEQTKYVEMMFDVPNIITPSNMYDYVEGLGYYQTMSLLCKRVYHTVITEWFKGSISFGKPYIYQTADIYPIVYLNGKKINNNFITSNNEDPYTVGVNIDSSIVYNVGDILSTELYLNSTDRTYLIKPEEGNTTLDIPFGDYIIVEEKELNVTVAGITKKYNRSYSEFTEVIGNIVDISHPTLSGWRRLIFGPSVYGKTFIIQNNARVYRWELNLDKMIQNSDPIIVNLNTQIYRSSYTVPVYYTPQTLVYLNGKHLIEGLDYTVQEIKDYNGNLIDKQIVIQSFEYLQSENNTLEYFVTSAEIENSIHGFVIDNKAFDQNNLELLFINMSTTHVNGFIEPDAEYKGTYISLPENKYRTGAPFELCTAVPAIVKEFLDEFHPNDDIERLEILTDYFYGKGPEYPEKIILEQSHRCYSVFTAPIIRDILNDTISDYISLDPDSDRFLTQLKDYDHYKEVDLVYNHGYDLRFVDVFPHYRNFEVEDINKYTIINAILAKILPEDEDTNYTTVKYN